MASKPNTNNLQINILVPESLRTGVHANLVSITSTIDGETIFDFIFSHPQEVKDNVQQGTLVSRVIIPTQVAKKLLPILTSQLGKIVKD